MTSRPPLSLAEQIAAAQDWWREAGADLAFADDAQTWLAAASDDGQGADPATHLPVASPAPVPILIGGGSAAWPRDLAEFQRWWVADASLDAGGTHPRVAPRGPQGAPLAVLVAMPEAGDTETLLSGPQGRLIAAIADALALAPEDLYLASALPRHAAMPDWNALHSQGLGQLLLHHLELAAPRRLLILGRDVLSLLGHDPAQSAPGISEIAIQDRQLPLLASYQPVRLLQRAQWRAGLWQRLLEWTEGDAH